MRVDCAADLKGDEQSAKHLFDVVETLMLVRHLENHNAFCADK